MNPEEFLKNNIPNPFEQKSSLPALSKKGEQLKEGLSLTTLAKNIFFLVVASLFLVIYIKIPAGIVILLIGAEVLVNLAAGYITLQKIKAVNAIDAQNNPDAYRLLLVTRERYGFIRSLFGFVAQLVAIILVFTLFGDELNKFAGQNILGTLSSNESPLKYLVCIFVVFRLSDLLFSLLKYSWIKTLKNTGDFSQTHQEGTLIEKKLDLVKFIPTASLIILVIFAIGIPPIIPLCFSGFIIFMILLSFVELQRIKKLDFGDQTVDKSVVPKKLEEFADEQIAGAVFGILKVATGLQDMFKPVSISSLGAGKSFYPENTLIVTNLRLLFIQIPLSGGNKVIEGVDYVQQNVFFNRDEIRQKGEELLKTSSMPALLTLTIRDVLYQDIKTITLKQSQLIIEKLSGEKLGYTFFDASYVDLLRPLFQSYLKDKFVEA